MFSADRQETVITDIKMPFWSMVFFMVKWAIAAIPAAIILFGVFLSLTVASILLLGSFQRGLQLLTVQPTPTPTPIALATPTPVYRFRDMPRPTPEPTEAAAELEPTPTPTPCYENGFRVPCENN